MRATLGQKLGQNNGKASFLNNFGHLPEGS